MDQKHNSIPPNSKYTLDESKKYDLYELGLDDSDIPDGSDNLPTTPRGNLGNLRNDNTIGGHVKNMLEQADKEESARQSGNYIR